MKYVKMFGLLAVAAAALMAFAGTASAVVTEAPGDPLDVGDTIHAHSENTRLTGALEVACGVSTVHGQVDSVSGGTATGAIDSLIFDECAKDTVTVIDAGDLTIHTNGTLTSDGAHVTIQVHRTFFGFPITTHCEYVTDETHIGTITEGTTPQLHVLAEIPKNVTDSSCGEGAATWEGTYHITSPHFLDAHA